MELFNFEFYRWEKEIAEQPFLLQAFGDTWDVYTWGQVGKMARKMANGLLGLGLAPKSHIALVSKNCREWIIADLAIMMAGYVSVPLFPTLSGKQISEVLDIGDVAAIFVGKMDHWEDMKTGIPASMPIIKFPHYPGNDTIDLGIEWGLILEANEPLASVRELYLEDTWTIIFTSGTTGTPKGVVLNYRTFDDSSIPTEVRNPLKLDLQGNNRFFSYLPLNHIAERLVVEATAFKYGGTISFSESIERFAQNLRDTKPTVFFGVPRIYTKFQQAILAKFPAKKLDLMLKIPFVSSLLQKKIKKGLGLADAKICVSGAAPLPQALKLWYGKIGIKIMNGYGMTENCAICTLLDPNVNKAGAVGKPQEGVELRINPSNGEILMKSPYLMTGYYKSPEMTAQVLEGGWLHTGDQGHIDDEGDLVITGRVKDTFKTTKGEFIVPGPIEWAFNTCLDIEQICLVGLGCPQPMAVVCLSETVKNKSHEELTYDLDTVLEGVNQGLPNNEKVSKIIIAKEAWTAENGVLTPTLKVKRNEIHKKYSSQLMDWQDSKDSIIFEV